MSRGIYSERSGGADTNDIPIQHASDGLDGGASRYAPCKPAHRFVKRGL